MIDHIAQQARAVKPQRVLLWLVMALPFLIGWLIGLLVYILAFIFYAGVAGYRTVRPHERT